MTASGEWGSRLLAKLDARQGSTGAGCFVLLWSYFGRAGLTHAETAAARAGEFARDLSVPPAQLRPEALQRTRDSLRSQAGAAFDLHALRWLRGLDEALQGVNPRTYTDAEFEGVGSDVTYRLHRRNNFLADTYHVTLPVAACQSLALEAHTRHHVAVPVQPQGGFTLQQLARHEWGDEYLHLRLRAERKNLKILLWPGVSPQYPSLCDLEPGRETAAAVYLDALSNEAAMLEAVQSALACARAARATVLILPELCVSTAMEAALVQQLENTGRDGYPILTLFGRLHRGSADSGLAWNEAVLLGPGGRELHVHRKLAPYVDYTHARLGERLALGDRISVLEADIGHLTPLICLDLFHEIIRPVVQVSHATVLLVPSLSPKTSAHRDAAKQLHRQRLVSSFVCNVWMEAVQGEDGSSFCRIPPEELVHRTDGYLLFDLAADLAARVP